MKAIVILALVLFGSALFALFVGAFIKAGKGPVVSDRLDVDGNEVL